MRGFVDYLIDQYNKECHGNMGIAVVKVTPRGDYNQWKQQGGLFHVGTKGIQQGSIVQKYELVDSVSDIIHAYGEWDLFLATAHNPAIKLIISNTTESGFVLSPEDDKDATPPVSFPAKLTAWLYERYLHFGGTKESACTFIPCELLIDNGKRLKELIMTTARKWELERGFSTWIETHHVFCSTLVDRIVPGIQREKLPEVWDLIEVEDHLATEGEPYHLWAIEGPTSVREIFPLDQAGLNVVFTDDLTPFRKRKVRILNGAHTALVPVGYLLGLRIVRDAVEDSLAGAFLSKLLNEEILPVMGMPIQEVEQYAATVIERFKNPYIDHYLISISLNSFSKFTARLLPSVQDYMMASESAPSLITCSLACLILMYRGTYVGEDIPLKDSQEVLARCQDWWTTYPDDMLSLVKEVLAWEDNWGTDLSQNDRLVQAVTRHLDGIRDKGMTGYVQQLVRQA